LLKKEIRILGIGKSKKPGKQTIVIGAIFRGNRWLDGIIKCALQPRKTDSVRTLAQAITNCRQYTQLRAAILSREWLSVWTSHDLLALSKKIEPPVIAIDTSTSSRMTGKKIGRERAHRTGVSRYLVNDQHRPLRVLATKLNYAETVEILSIASTGNNAIPEAVRVAQLIADRASNLRID